MKFQNKMKKSVLACAVLLSVLSVGAMAEAAMNWTLATPTGNTYKTSIAKTVVQQAVKDGDITLGNQINFGTYMQSSNGSGGFNTDPVAWIVVEKDTGGTAGRFTLVSTKALDAGQWDASGTGNNWGNLNSDASQANNNMRAYMNNTMYDTLTNGMTAAQKAFIQDSIITTYKASSVGFAGTKGWDNIDTTNPDNILCTTTDKLYLMSIQELHDWFKNDVDTNPTNDHSSYSKVSWGAGMTDYSEEKGLWASYSVTGVDGSSITNYILRSPSSYSPSHVRTSNSIGAVTNRDVTSTNSGVRPALQIDFSSLIFTSASEYSYTTDAKFTKGKGSAVTGGDAVLLDTIGDSDTLDLTLYDAGLGAVTTNTTLELNEDDIKLGYSGSGTDKSVVGMLATGDSSGYTPVAWGRMAEGSASGTGVFGLGNADADTEYSLLIFNEQGTGTSFIGDANVFDGLKKNSSNKTELDLTTTNNASKTFNGAVTVGDGNKLTANADQLTGTDDITDNGTLIFVGGTLGRIVSGTGDLTFAGDVSTNADNIATTGTNTVASDKTVSFTGGTLTAKMEGAGNLDFAGDVSTNADNIATTGTNTVASDKTVTFTDGEITQKWEGAGNLKFGTDMSIDADNLANTGTNTVESGKKVTFTSGNITQNWDGAGTAEFNNTVSVADGVKLQTVTNNVNGSLDVAGNITASNINFKSGSTLKIDGTKITGTAAISGLTSATVANGAKLYVCNAEKDTEYKILAGSGLDVQSWQTDDDMADEFKTSYGLKVDAVTNDGSVFNITFKEDTQATSSSDIGNIVANLPADGKVKAWVDEISASQSDTATQGNTVNTLANSAQLANVQTGTCVINNLATENIWDNRDIIARPMLGSRWQRLKVRNVTANFKDNVKIETVEQGQASGIMPEQQKEQVYSKEIWASYIHSKQKVDGMETGHLQQNGNIQYNGVTVGTDLWSGRHGFGGVALTYADGNVNSTQKVSNVKNNVDYYGLTVYNRQDVGKFSFQYDGGITHSKNDVTMSTQGAEDVTARPKVNIYNIGGRVENSYKLSEKAEVVPFAGLRYTFVKTKEYHNSLGMGFDVDDQHMWNVPVGVAFRSNFGDVDGWLMGSTLEAGYAWNLGDRDSEQRITYGNTYDVVGFNTADKGQYFVKAALQAKRKNLSGEVGYRYSKGDTVRDSRWNFNVGISF